MSSTYQPKTLPEPINAAVVNEELRALKAGLEDAAPFHQFVLRTAEPSLILPRMVVYADGTNWNPGSGEGIYRRNAANSAWVFLG